MKKWIEIELQDGWNEGELIAIALASWGVTSARLLDPAPEPVAEVVGGKFSTTYIVATKAANFKAGDKLYANPPVIAMSVPAGWMSDDGDVIGANRMPAKVPCFSDDFKIPLWDHPPVMEAMGWQNIESAPRDGSQFLAFEYGYGIQITAWSTSHDGGAGGFRNTHHGWNPTYWMPLPAAPNLRSVVAPEA